MNQDLYIVRFESNLVVVGTLLEATEDEIVLGTPLKMDLEDMFEGEYVGFSTIVPFQMDHEISFKRKSILFMETVTSESLRYLYHTNIPIIEAKMQTFAADLEASQEERRRTLN